MYNRYKSLGRPAYLEPGMFTENHYEDGVLQDSTPIAGISNTTFEEMYGQDTPLFNKKKREGILLPITEFSQTREDWIATSISWDISTSTHTSYRAKTGSCQIHDARGVGGLIATDNSEALKTQAVAKLYASGFDAGTFLAEIQQLIKMFRTFAFSLSKFVQKYDPKKLTSTYLEVRYGIRPLLYDMVAISKVIQEMSAGPRKVNRAQQGKTTSATEVIPLRFGSIAFDCRAETTLNERVVAFSRVAPPSVLIDPAITGWEVLRFSFILDWFFDVGSWIAALRGKSFHADVICAYGRKTDVVSEFLNGRVATDLFPSYSGTASIGGIYRRVSVTRVPIGTESFEIPVQFNFDLLKFLDVVAIAKQLSRISNQYTPRKRVFRYRAPKARNLAPIRYTTSP